MVLLGASFSAVVRVCGCCCFVTINVYVFGPSTGVGLW